MALSDISENAKKVLQARYLAKNEAGEVTESLEDLFRRVATAIADADALHDEGADTALTARRFYRMMTDLRFLPNSPTLMNAGRPLGQLSACFVLPVEDSMEGIFDAIKYAALIHKSGGGTGFSFSRLRAKGATVNSTGGVASGPVSFMRVFNMATEAVKQGGTRRGANMGVLRIDHPDILEFIDCKKDNTDITNFNISVGLTEAFMDAAENGEDYHLIDPHTKEVTGTLNAKEVFEKIVNAAWTNGEPGILFMDRLNRDNPVPTQGEIESTNPCGEQPLLPYESCNLGSINLAKMLKEDASGEIDWELLAETTRDAVHFLDNVIDVNSYPLAQISEVTRETRKIGLGVMGFADLLLLLDIPYNSDEALALAERVMAFITNEAREASADLAKTRGAFPLFEGSIYKEGPPLRNATVTTIAPTGTLSIIAGCSSGVEPVFAYAFTRTIMDGTEMVEGNPILQQRLEEQGLFSEELMDEIARQGTIAHIEEVPEDIRRVFVSAHDISPYYHIQMQAAFQRHVDNAVSKTVNFGNAATKEDVAEVYRLAYVKGCKGVTIYRDGSRDGQVLSVKGDAAVPSPKEVLNQMPDNLQPYGQITPRPRPAITTGFTERMKIGCGNLYVTVNYDENGICEVFTSTGKAGGCPSQSEATARLCSVALRSGMSVREVCTQLRGIRCPSTIRQRGMSCTSCPDAIAKVVMKVNDFIEAYNGEGPAPAEQLAPEPLTTEAAPPAGPSYSPAPAPKSTGAVASATGKKQISQCPDCGATIEHEGGCVICRQCGFSHCG